MENTKLLLTDKDLEKRYGYSRHTWRVLRVKGGGPPFVKLGVAVRYDVRDVEKWLASRKFASTSQREDEAVCQ